VKVTVDLDVCLRHARCCVTAPEVFQLDDGGVLQFDEHPDPRHRDAVEDAVDGCPTQAITVED
jgi:ferredoxin